MGCTGRRGSSPNGQAAIRSSGSTMKPLTPTGDGVQACYPGKAFLHRVDPFIGLTHTDFAQVRRWLATR